MSKLWKNQIFTKKRQHCKSIIWVKILSIICLPFLNTKMKTLFLTTKMINSFLRQNIEAIWHFYKVILAVMFSFLFQVDKSFSRYLTLHLHKSTFSILATNKWTITKTFFHGCKVCPLFHHMSRSKKKVKTFQCESCSSTCKHERNFKAKLKRGNGHQ